MTQYEQDVKKFWELFERLLERFEKVNKINKEVYDERKARD